MKCTLCEKEIPNYSREFNHLLIDDKHNVNVCEECIDKFMKWRQQYYSKLFPTKVMKKINNK